MYLIPADRAAGRGLARGWSRPAQERSLPQANRARRRCEIRHYAPVARGRTSPSGCQGATLVTAGVIPAPVGPDPAQPCLPSRVHLQVRGGIAGPRVGFQAPAANKTLCRGTFALSALGEVWGPCGAAWGAQRAGGARSCGPNPAPRCAPPPGQADLPLPPQPRPSLSCQVRPLHPESLLIFKGRDRACAGNMLHRAPPLGRGQ